MTRWVKYWVVNLSYPAKEINIECESEDEARQALQDITKAIAAGEQSVAVRGGRTFVVLSDLLTADVTQFQLPGQ